MGTPPGKRNCIDSRASKGITFCHCVPRFIPINKTLFRTYTRETAALECCLECTLAHPRCVRSSAGLPVTATLAMSCRVGRNPRKLDNGETLDFDVYIPCYPVRPNTAPRRTRHARCRKEVSDGPSVHPIWTPNPLVFQCKLAIQTVRCTICPGQLDS